MGGFFSFLILLVIAYLLWRVTDQLPDLIFRLSEVQRDVAEIRRNLTPATTPDTPAAEPAREPAPSAPAAPAAPEVQAADANDDTSS